MLALLTVLVFVQDSAIDKLADEWARVAERVQPSVVSVTATRDVKVPYEGTSVDAKVPIEFAGVVVGADGWILTDASGVFNAKAEQISVKLPGGRTFEVKEKRMDRSTALALLKIDATGLTPLEFTPGASRAGQPILVCGNPYGMTGTVVLGNVSGTGRSVKMGKRQFDDLLQLSVQAVPGDGGAAVADGHGRIAGVVIGGYTPLRSDESIQGLLRFFAAGGRGSMTLTFAVPSDVAEFVVRRLMKSENVDRGWIGVTLEPVDDAERAQLPAEFSQAARVKSVVRRGPAAAAGLKSGDVLVALNGRPMSDLRSRRMEIWSAPQGQMINAVILDKGKTSEVAVKIGVEPATTDAADESDF